MKLDNYPWLIAPYQQLITPILQKKAHHALLIQYVRGSGENELIFSLIKRLLCQQSNDFTACQDCHSCRLFESENHPDYYMIAAESGKHSIGIDQIRMLSNKIYEKSQQGGNKVIWIKSAGLMTEAASNALLKTLEEPPEYTYFILSDDHNTQLLPTIHSRCFSYFLPIPAIDASIKWLKINYQNYSQDALTSALQLNENAPLAAYAMLEPQKWHQRQQFCEWLSDAIDKNDYWSLSQKIGTEHAIDYINWFCSLLSDTLKIKQHADHFIINRDQTHLIKRLATYENQTVIQLYDQWLLTRERLLTISGVNRELIIHHLLSQSELLSTIFDD